MQVLRLCWVGTRSSDHRGTVEFFKNVLGLAVIDDPGDFTVLAVPDGSTVEIFGPTSPYNAHLTSPVAGFEVADLTLAETELQAAGTEIVLPITGGAERRWLHFRAPDGHLYELVENTQPSTM
jgi:catechol 2,3-dioxygenase-like lactoylglutathione lyase family enzyme